MHVVELVEQSGGSTVVTSVSSALTQPTGSIGTSAPPSGSPLPESTPRELTSGATLQPNVTGETVVPFSTTAVFATEIAGK